MRDATSRSAGRVSVGTVFATVLLGALVAGFGWQRWQQVPRPTPVAAASPPVASAASRPGTAPAIVPAPVPVPVPVPAEAPGTGGGLVATPGVVASAPQRVADAERPPRVQPRPAPPVPAQSPEPEVQSSPAERPRLQAWVVVAGQEISADAERISLPTGARLALKLRTNAPGTVALYTVNPQGVSSEGPIWKAAIRSQTAVTSPMLRLEGTQGLETIRVQFKPAAGGQAVWRTVQLLHL